MKTALTTENAATPAQRYPRGRWTGSDSRPTPSEQPLGALLRNLSSDESALLRDATERLTAMLEAADVRPPFMTAMDCPMPEAA